MEATEAGESELGHALDQAGRLLTRENLQGKGGEMGEWRKAEERSKLGLMSQSTLALVGLTAILSSWAYW